MTVKACVIGWPIKHSRSPLIHGHWLSTYGIDGTYTKEAVAPDDLDAFLSGLADNGYAGCNVTVPHKERALALADDASAAARAIGATNTLWLADGRLQAGNTDAYGFLANLDEKAPRWGEGTNPVLVLGAGGAARAVLYALVSRDVKEIRLVNRTRSRAEELAGHFGEPVQVLDWEERVTGAQGCSLIVNTTSLGMTGEPPLAFDLAGAPTGTVVNDLVYAPLETQLLRQARERGLRAVDGLGMLLHQAVPGFEKWFGLRPEVTDQLRAQIVADLESA